MADSGYLYTVGDTGKDLNATCSDGTVPADLTGISSIKARIERPRSTTIIRDASVVDAVAGKVRFDWEDGDLSVDGTYHLKFQVTYSNGEVQSFPAAAGGSLFKVSKQIA